MTRSGEEFKAFNLLLLDEKVSEFYNVKRNKQTGINLSSSSQVSLLNLFFQNNRLHAFIPGNLADQNSNLISNGNLYVMYDFTVKEYKPEEKFRCVRSEMQIIFTNSTKVEALLKDDKLIQDNMFDFSDLGDLKGAAHKNIYLTGKNFKKI